VIDRQFLYPTKLQFPFDAVCGQIVRALEARAWKVPGFTVELREYGSGQQLLRHVSSIKSDQSALDLGQHDVRIEFGRPQGLLPEGRYNDCAAVNEIQLARRSLRVYEDESGPTYNVYVGDAWERDRSTWWTRPNTRLNKALRLCVKYSGWRPYAGRAGRLAWDKDGREYGPEGGEPETLDTHTIMEEFRSCLQDVVLPAIEAHPVADAPVVYEEPAVIPMPAGVGALFAYADGGARNWLYAEHTVVARFSLVPTPRVDTRAARQRDDRDPIHLDHETAQLGFLQRVPTYPRIGAAHVADAVREAWPRGAHEVVANPRHRARPLRAQLHESLAAATASSGGCVIRAARTGQAR